jgi:hypothetical protein
MCPARRSHHRSRRLPDKGCCNRTSQHCRGVTAGIAGADQDEFLLDRQSLSPPHDRHRRRAAQEGPRSRHECEARPDSNLTGRSGDRSGVGHRRRQRLRRSSGVESPLAVDPAGGLRPACWSRTAARRARRRPVKAHRPSPPAKHPAVGNIETEGRKGDAVLVARHAATRAGRPSCAAAARSGIRGQDRSPWPHPRQPRGPRQ